jgi:hypothetical protein
LWLETVVSQAWASQVGAVPRVRTPNAEAGVGGVVCAVDRRKAGHLS